MADETQAAVNSMGAPASAPGAEHNSVAATPAVETNGATQNGADVRIPKARFDQVIDQRNREREMREKYEARIRELEARQPNPAEKTAADSAVDRLVSRLGLEKTAAEELTQVTREIARAERQQVEQRLQQYELNGWRDNLARKYADYSEMEGKMAQVWNNLEPHERQLSVASQRGLEMLYRYAKGETFDSAVNKAAETAAKEAYENKLAKQAVSSMPGSVAKSVQPLTREAIAAMSLEDYKARREEINEAIKSGRLK